MRGAKPCGNFARLPTVCHQHVAGEPATVVAAPAAVNTPRHNLEVLEVAIDGCMMLARNLDRERLDGAIQMLRKARNAVVWLVGK